MWFSELKVKIILNETVKVGMKSITRKLCVLRKNQNIPGAEGDREAYSQQHKS